MMLVWAGYDKVEPTNEIPVVYCTGVLYGLYYCGLYA